MVLIRPALAEDLPDAALVHNAAFATDEFMRFIFPNAEKRPLAHKWSVLQRFKMALSTPGTFLFVAVTEPADAAHGNWSGTEEIVGFSHWMRVGNDKAARAWKEPKENFTNQLDNVLLNFERKVLDWFHADQAVSYPNSAALNSQHRGFLARRIPNAWFLRGLCVSPTIQRQGVGAKLLQFGISNGEAEGVPVMLNASPVGEGLYRKCGFRTAYFTPIHRDVNLGVAMVRDPLGQYTRPLREGEVKIVNGVKMEVAWLHYDLDEVPAPEAEELEKDISPVAVAGQG